MTTLYVRTDGSDTNSGTGDSASGAFRTVRKGVTSLASQDTLILRANLGNQTTYIETSGSGPPIDFITPAQSGTLGNPTTVRTLPEEERMVVVKRDVVGGSSICKFTPSASADQAFYKLRGLVLDGYKDSARAKTYIPVWCAGNSGGASVHSTHDVTIENCELRNASGGPGLFVEGADSTGTVAGTSNNITARDCWFRDNGDTTARHNIYIQGYGCLIDRCVLSGSAGLGLQVVFTGTRPAGSPSNCDLNTVSNCVVYGNGQSGLYCEVGDGNKFINCVSYNNTSGFRADNGATNTLIYNCTAYNNSIRNFGLGANGQSTGTLLTNCVARKGSGPKNFEVLSASTYTLLTCTNIAAVDTDATDPLFVDPANGDFRLLAGSPCVNAGTDLSGTFTTDLLQVTRPWGSAWDQGVYEYTGAPMRAMRQYRQRRVGRC